jgi:hypothetical protein
MLMQWVQLVVLAQLEGEKSKRLQHARWGFAGVARRRPSAGLAGAAASGPRRARARLCRALQPLMFEQFQQFQQFQQVQQLQESPLARLASAVAPLPLLLRRARAGGCAAIEARVLLRWGDARRTSRIDGLSLRLCMHLCMHLRPFRRPCSRAMFGAQPASRCQSIEASACRRNCASVYTSCTRSFSVRRTLARATRWTWPMQYGRRQATTAPRLARRENHFTFYGSEAGVLSLLKTLTLSIRRHMQVAEHRRWSSMAATQPARGESKKWQTGQGALVPCF